MPWSDKIECMKAKKRRQKTDAITLLRLAIGLLLIVVGFVLGLGAAGYAGTIGGIAYQATAGAIGFEALLLPILVVVIGIAVLAKRMLVSFRTATGIVLILIAVLAFLGTISPFGGSAGAWLGVQLVLLIGMVGAISLLIVFALIGLALATDIIEVFESLQKNAVTARDALSEVRLPFSKRNLKTRKKAKKLNKKTRTVRKHPRRRSRRILWSRCSIVNQPLLSLPFLFLASTLNTIPLPFHS
jgi:hypothetical protein